MRVLLIEPDAEAGYSLELVLKSEGFDVYTAESGDEGADLAKVYDYSAIITEMRLPDMDGVAVIRAIRAAKVPTPVLVLAGDALVATKVSAFTAGADDYLCKPFHRDEMVARLVALIRRSVGQATACLGVGPVTVDIANKQVLVDGERVHLTGKEYAIVEALALRQGHVLTKEAILNAIYGGMDEPEIKIIDVFICKIRNKFKQLGVQVHLETVWGQGYRLAADPTLPREARVQREAQMVGIRAALLAALSVGDRSFRQLTTDMPSWSSVSVRGALSRLMGEGFVTNLGDQRRALYHLQRGQVAA